MLMAKRDGFKVFIRGKWVAFDHTTINGYYGLVDLEDDQYQALLESDATNWDDMKNALCKELVAWKRYTNGGLKSFPRQAMKKIAKIWHFLCVPNYSPQLMLVQS